MAITDTKNAFINRLKVAKHSFKIVQRVLNKNNVSEFVDYLNQILYMEGYILVIIKKAKSN